MESYNFFQRLLKLALHKYSLENNLIQEHITFNSSCYWHNIKIEQLWSFY